MNKSLQLVFLGISVIGCSLLLTACSSEPKAEDTKIQHSILDRRIGEIKELSSVDMGYGTHLLKMADGSTILLASSTLNLNDDQFKTKKVEVSGKLDYTRDNRQIMDVENIDILDDIEIKEDLEPVVWKDYENHLLGFSIKYRSDFEIEEENAKVTLVKTLPLEKKEEEVDVSEENTANKPEDDEVQYSISLETEQLEAGQTLDQYLGTESLGSEDLSAHGFIKNKIGEQNLDAFKRFSDSSGMIEFFVNNGTTVYHLAFEGSDQTEIHSEYQNVFYQIVNSLRLSSLLPSDSETSTNETLPPENASSEEQHDTSNEKIEKATDQAKLES